MKLPELLRIASEAYPKELDGLYYPDTGELDEDNMSSCGDGLAVFIVREIAETFYLDADDFTQVKTAIQAMATAVNELLAVVNGLVSEMDSSPMP